MSQAKATGLIPEAWHEFFRDNCICGHPISITENRKTFWCTNPRCIIKMKYSARDVVSNLDLKGMGDEYCYRLLDRLPIKKVEQIISVTEQMHSSATKLVEGFPLDSIEEMQDRIRAKCEHIFERVPQLEYSPLVALTASLNDHIAVSNEYTGRYNYNAIREALKKPLTFGEAVGKCSLPELGPATSLKIFGKFNDVDAVITDMNTSNLDLYDWVHRQNDYNGFDCIGPWANTIATFLTEIVTASIIFNIVKGGETLKIAVTGEVAVDGYGYTRKKFMDLVKLESSGIYTVMESDSFSTLRFVVSDFPSNTRKYKEGKSRGILITAQEFVDMIRNKKPKVD